MTVKIEKEMFGENEHLTLRVGKSGIRVSRDDLEEIQTALQEFRFEGDEERRECPKCGCVDMWQRNNCILGMYCTNCDHEESDTGEVYYNEEHEVI